MRVDIGPIVNIKGASLPARGEAAPTGDLPAGFKITRPAAVDAIVSNTGRFLHVEGRIGLGLQAECVRCLARYGLDLSVPFCQDYSHGTLEREDLGKEFIPYTGNVLELDPAVYEAILLALPMKPLCRDNCPGLCVRCGKNLNEGICGCASEPGRSGLADLARLLPKKEV